MANESYSVYPNALDGYATLPLRKNLVHEIRAEDHNRLRDAIVKIEQELGIQPSGTFATVADRLDNIIDAKSIIELHIAEPTDAHDASAISVADSDDLFLNTNVETVLAELGLLLPHKPDTLGANLGWVPNSGVPSFVDGYGTKFVYNVSDWAGEPTDNEIKRTQTRSVNGIQGIRIIEVSNYTNNGLGRLSYTPADNKLYWQAPGDPISGEGVDLSGLSEGEQLTVYSSDTTKSLRFVRNSGQLQAGAEPEYEEFLEVFGLEARTGYFSIPTQGFKESEMLTRTATDPSGTSRFQFMLSGMIYPANTGTLVLQRKRHVDDNFFPIATLDLDDNFNEANRETGQLPYLPSLNLYDTITLFDRFPARRDYNLALKRADGTQVYENFAIDYPHTQLARYLIPVSNSTLVGGELTTATETTFDEVHDNTSAYRLVHYKAGVTDFTGEPSSSNIWSVADEFGTSNDGNNTIRFSNLFVDPNKDRPGVDIINLTPPRPDTAEESFMHMSGVKYYDYDASSSINRFGFRLQSNDNFASNTYLINNVLRFKTEFFDFPNGVGSDGYSIWGAQVDLTELSGYDMVDGYVPFSSTNLPEYDSRAWYVVDREYNTTRKLKLLPNVFSANAYITARFSDPFGPGDGYDGYGDSDPVIFDRSVADNNLRTRILVNTYGNRSTESQEYFTDENYRIGENETFMFPTNSGKFTHADGAHIIGGDGDDGYVLAEWNSGIVLGYNSLQQGARWISSESNVPGLIYPQNNYSSGDIMPFQFDETITYLGDDINIIYESPGSTGLAANYDGYGSGPKIYQRMFSLGYPVSNARLRVVSGGENPVSFHDIAFYNEKRFAKIEVKIPGNNDFDSTEWLDIGRVYASGSYEQADSVQVTFSDGALVGQPTGGPGDFTVSFTFGRRNNANSGGMVAVRVTYAPDDHGSWTAIVEDAKTRILTMLELLPPLTSDL